MRAFIPGISLGISIACAATAPPDPARQFAETIKPVLVPNCAACHNRANPKNRIDFLGVMEKSFGDSTGPLEGLG